MKIIKHGKADDFEKLYFDTFTFLCKSIFRIVKDEDITKDIVQDVFLKYWQKNHEIRITENPKFYLHKACINQALNYLKEKSRRDHREGIFIEEIQESDNTSQRPDANYEANEISNTIQEVIDQLPPACKSAFLLSRHEEKSYKEIAALMNISLNTVEKHIGKALKNIRKVLERN